MFHVTTEDWGDSKILHPRQPQTMSDSEPRTPRVCFAPTLWQCFVAVDVGWYDDFEDWHVYEISDDMPLVEPFNVHDSDLTEEKWSILPTKVKYLDTIPSSVIKYIRDYSIERGTIEGMPIQVLEGKMIKQILEMEGYE